MSGHSSPRLAQAFSCLRFISFIVLSNSGLNRGLKVLTVPWCRRCPAEEVVSFSKGRVFIMRLGELQNDVQAYQGKEQPVTVQRQAELVHLKLTPKPWTGQGILGTTLIPL